MTHTSVNSKKLKNRWLIALAGIFIHLSIGSAYAWSIFSNPIQSASAWSESQISFAFSLAIFCLGFSAAFMGRITDKHGPRLTGTISAIFFGAGIALTGWAISVQSLPMLYLSYGLIGGIGLGTGYVTPVSTMMAWFPDRPGIATGMAIMGFGFATLITTPIAEALMASVGVSNTFYILGVSYFVIILFSAQYMEKPPVGWVPKGFVPKNEPEVASLHDEKMFSASDALRTKRFWMLWTMLFINITCGIALISVAAPLAEKATGMSAVSAATMVAIMGLFNGGGRFIWAMISDYIGRPNVFTTFFIIDVTALVILYFTKSPVLFFVIICLLMTCYGGGFSSVPIYIRDMFGDKVVASIHGYILTAWALAGLVGPLLLSWVTDMTHSYSAAMLVFAGLSCVALALSIAIRSENAKYAPQESPVPLNIK
ncbi:MAG: OFA family MFS transporter [Enterococcus sp.]|nr:OFA family MFS transporter [Enterococcus sp.]HRM24334.1 OFA family MFS transporter [Enterococcus aquimarinus]